MFLKADTGLLILRVVPAFMMMTAHGWGKLSNFSAIAPNFPDPIGLGGTISLALAVFAEFFCSIALILGFKTRFAAVPLFITMVVAALIVHAGDPFSKKELAILYAITFLVLIFTGGGRFSLDIRLRSTS